LPRVDKALEDPFSRPLRLVLRSALDPAHPGLGNQKILEGLEVIDKEVRTKNKTRSQPIVDANDVSKLLLTLRLRDETGAGRVQPQKGTIMFHVQMVLHLSK
jgi:hypothetical protein